MWHLSSCYQCEKLSTYNHNDGSVPTVLSIFASLLKPGVRAIPNIQDAQASHELTDLQVLFTTFRMTLKGVYMFDCDPHEFVQHH